MKTKQQVDPANGMKSQEISTSNVILMPPSTTIRTATPATESNSESVSNNISFLEVQKQIDQTTQVQLHTKDLVYYHLLTCCFKSQHKGELYETKLFSKIDFFIDNYVYSATNTILFSISTLILLIFILGGLYNWNHILTIIVYLWFIYQEILLFLTANYRLFKTFVSSFTVWYKVGNIAVAIFARQLCVDGIQRFTSSTLHMISGILCVFCFVFANGIVAVIESYNWPHIMIFNHKLNLNVYLKGILIICLLTLNGVEIVQLFFSHDDYILKIFGYQLSLRVLSISTFNSATLWYLQQIYYNIFYPNMIMTTIGYQWLSDANSYHVRKKFRDVNLLVKVDKD